MLFLNSDEPSRWQRARDAARDTTRSARSAVEGTTRSARSAVEGTPRALRLLVVPVAVAAVVLVVRMVRTRSAAGEETTAEEAEGGSPESPSPDRRDGRQLQPSGKGATS